MPQVNLEELRELIEIGYLSEDRASLLLEELPHILKELEVLREAVKRFEGMDGGSHSETVDGVTFTWGGIDKDWEKSRNTISACVKEHLG